MPQFQRGFALIELMVTLAVLGIILAVAIPSFSTFLEKKRLDGTANEYLGIINYAKSEALKQNTAIFIIATRASAKNWSITAATSATCTLGTSCDLKTFNSSAAPSIAVDTAFTGVNTATIDSVRLLPSFGTTQTATFSTNNYSIRAEWLVTGLTRLCIPSGALQFGGYPTC